MKNTRRSILFVLLAAALSALILWRGIATGMPNTISFQYALHYAPMAVSTLVYGRKFDYASYKLVQERFSETFFRTRNFENAANAAAQLDRQQVAESGTYLAEHNDKGPALFTLLAFMLFGVASQALFYFYFLILLASAAIFIAAFHERSDRMLLLICFLLALYVVAIPLQFHGLQLGGFHAQRALPILAFIPALHLMCALDGKPDWHSAIMILAQAAILVFVCFLRASAAWAVVSLAVATLFSAAYRLGAGHFRNNKTLAATLGPLLTVCLFFAGLQAHKRMTFHPGYFGDVIQTRVMWHNVYYATHLYPALAQDLYGKGKVPASDGYVTASLRRYLERRGRADEWTNMERRAGKRGLVSVYALSDYERLVREMYLEAWLKYPWRMARLYLVAKPLAFIQLLLDISRPAGGENADAGQTGPPARGYNPLDPLALISLAVATGLCALGQGVDRRQLYGTSLLATVIGICSQLSWIAAYPLFFVMAGSVVGITFLVYIAASLGIIFLSRALRRRYA